MRRLLLLLLLLLPASASVAGTLYRCIGPSGEVAFTNSRSGFRDCRVVRNYAEPARTTPVSRPAALSVGASQTPRVELRTAPGDAEPKPVEASNTPTQVRRGAVYKYMKGGVAHYTNRPPAGQNARVLFTYIETCFACSAAPGLDFNSIGLNTTAYADEIRNAASLNGIEESWVRAVVHAESAFNANAISNKGAQGLMQLMPATAQRFGVSDPFTASENIAGGSAYLSWLLKRFNGDLRLATAAYNAGEGSVDRFSGVPPFQETQLFVERVGILHQRYKVELASAAKPKG